MCCQNTYTEENALHALTQWDVLWRALSFLGWQGKGVSRTGSSVWRQTELPRWCKQSITECKWSSLCQQTTTFSLSWINISGSQCAGRPARSPTKPVCGITFLASCCYTERLHRPRCWNHGGRREDGSLSKSLLDGKQRVINLRPAAGWQAGGGAEDWEGAVWLFGEEIPSSLREASGEDGLIKLALLRATLKTLVSVTSSGDAAGNERHNHKDRRCSTIIVVCYNLSHFLSPTHWNFIQYWYFWYFSLHGMKVTGHKQMNISFRTCRKVKTRYMSILHPTSTCTVQSWQY